MKVDKKELEKAEEAMKELGKNCELMLEQVSENLNNIVRSINKAG